MTVMTRMTGRMPMAVVQKKVGQPTGVRPAP
jgi:hypothetical protein